MKKHAIIPIFIPHLGCPNDCVFCNQRKITARSAAPSIDEVRATIEQWLGTLAPKTQEETPARCEPAKLCNDAPAGVDTPAKVRALAKVRASAKVCEPAKVRDVTAEADEPAKVRGTIEVAFYGGSFTGLPIEQQSAYLAVAKEFLDAGRIDGIHLSTRPDYIDKEILDNLKKYGVSTIEIGVQSFDDTVLKLSKRGHSASVVYESAKMIKNYGFRLGIQLMIGLPGDSMESCVFSAHEAAALKPELARLYPTIVLDDTELLDMYKSEEYKALDREEAVLRTLAMYKILDDAGIYIMRVGLKSTDIIGDGGAVNGGTYHPAFRQLVEGRLMREVVEAQLEEILKELPDAAAGGTADVAVDGVTNGAADVAVDGVTNGVADGAAGGAAALRGEKLPRITVYSNPTWFSNLVGNAKENRFYFERKYPELSIRYGVDRELADKKIRIELK